MQTTKISWAFRKLILRWSWIGVKKKLLQDVNFETIKKKNAVVQMGGGSPIMHYAGFFDNFAQDSWSM